MTEVVSEDGAPPGRVVPKLARAGRLSFFLALLACLLQPAHAQFNSCPFSEDAAVPDTLDPVGYYPLALQNAWEYVRWGGCCLDSASRHEVVGDTLVAERVFQIVRVREVLFDGQTGDPRDSSAVVARRVDRRYVTLDEDGRLLEWTSDSGARALRDLSQAFQSCESDPDTGVLTVVWALPTAAYELGKNASTVFQPPAGKGMDVGGEQFLYQYGLGYVSGEEGDSIEVMTYAGVDGLEFGRPLSELFGAFWEPEWTSVEVPSLHTFSIVNYPNPFADRTSFSVELGQPGEVTLQIVDLLGRRVAAPVENRAFERGKHTISWTARGLASGVYFVQFVHNGRLISSRSIVIAK